MDYSPDQTITWSIPIVGSVIVIQIYMIWKTNYDQMVQEQREVEAKKLGGSIVKDTPLIQPGVTNLADANKKGGAMVNLTLSPSVLDDEE